MPTFLAIALVLPWTAFATINQNCLLYTEEGSCCPQAVPTTFQPCASTPLTCAENTAIKCADVGKYPGIGRGYPLGMINGLILEEQLVFPDNRKQKNDARKMFKFKNGWTPSDKYWSSANSYVNFVPHSIPKNFLGTLPVFMEVDFLEAKRVFYFIIGKATGNAAERKFSLIYRDIHGKRVVYGDRPDYAEIFVCKSFSTYRRPCRIQVTPFRARAIRIVSRIWVISESYFLEVGGFHSLQADHHWSLNTVKKSYFPDIVGSLDLMKTRDAVEMNYTAHNAGEFLSVNDTASADLLTYDTSCIPNPTNCKYGLSIAFWIKVNNGSEEFSLLTVGSGGASQNHIGFKVTVTQTKKLGVSVLTAAAHYNASLTIPHYGWSHFAVTWSMSSGILLYEDGALMSNGSFVPAVNTLSPASKIEIGAGPANGEVLHDLKIWSYQLSGNDVMNVFSPGKRIYQQKSEDMAKFRPRSCLEAVTAYGRRVAVYDIYHVNGSFPMKCHPVENGVKFYLFPDIPAYNVTGPWQNKFEASIRYEQDSREIISKLIASATRCRQIVKHQCIRTGPSAIQYYDWNNELLEGSCEGGSCNCHGSDGLQNDTKVYNATGKLPLTKVIRVPLTESIRHQMFDVGPVECFQDMRVYQSCKEALDMNSMMEGKYHILTTVKSIMAHCSARESNIVTRMDHEYTESLYYVSGYEDKLSYVQAIRYDDDFASIVAVVDASDSCSQQIDITCHHSMVNANYFAVTDRDGKAVSFACNGGSCNCANNDAIIRGDTVLFSQKAQLPMTSFKAGDTGSPGEYLFVKFGSLECISNAAAGSSGQNCSAKFNGKSCYESKISNLGSCENEMDDDGCCKFPFTYKGFSYKSCTAMDSKIPWCSMTSVYAGQWRYCVSSLPKADIDFSLGAKEATGDWKIGNSCKGSTGPCYDMTFSSTPNEKSHDSTGLHRLTFESVSSYDKATGDCTQKFIGSSNYTLSAISYFATDLTRPEFLTKAITLLKAKSSSKEEASIHVYAVLPMEQPHKSYVTKCKYRYFRSAMHFGPIVWRYGPLTADAILSVPDLSDIVAPILRSNDPNVSQKHVFLVFEWQEFSIGRGISHDMFHFYDLLLKYQVGGPGNYLFADNRDVKRPGTAFVYDAKFISPMMKCIRFWYFMNSVGDSMLTVNLHQVAHMAKEILRIRGDQGKKWKKATIPLSSLLEANGNLVKVSFVAVYGAQFSRSIAIDDISFLSETCTLQPDNQHEYGIGHLPRATVLIPLDHSRYDNSSSPVTFTGQIPNQTIADNFGYPHLHASWYEGHPANFIRYESPSRLVRDFTVCINIRPSQLGNEARLLRVPIDDLELRIWNSTCLFFEFLTMEGRFSMISQPILTENAWNFVCIVFEPHRGNVKLFLNRELKEERYAGHVLPNITLNTVNIGPKGSSASSFSLTCLQIYDRAIDDAFIPTLELCPNRHMKNACKVDCKGESVCDQLTQKCVCPSYANRFVNEDCSSALASTVYGGSTDYMGFDDRRTLRGETFQSIAEAMECIKTKASYFEDKKFVFGPGPINSALCTLFPSAINQDLQAGSCLSSGACVSGSTLAFWLYTPAVTNWHAIGNATLLTYGTIKILYGVVNDMRNGTTQQIPALMFAVTSNSETWLWVSMIYGSQITEAWSHIAVTVDSSQNLAVYYNGEASYAVKSAKVEPAETVTNKLVTGSLPYTCFDEIVAWEQVQLASVIEKIYNVSVYGGQQGIRSRIRFKMMSAKEPGDLWAVDRSNVAYKYHEGAWVSLPGERVEVIHVGMQGVLASLENNSLIRRTGIGPKNPTGSAWERIPTLSNFIGRIIDLSTTLKGNILAKSVDKWHCVDTSPQTADKTVTMLAESNGFSQISCNGGKCWGVDTSFHARQFFEFGECTFNAADDSLADKKISAIATGNYWPPFAIDKETKEVLKLKSNRWGTVKSGQNYSDSFTNLVVLNGLVAGVKINGEIDYQHLHDQPFLITRPGGADDTKCLYMADPEFKVTSQSRCLNLLFRSKQGCFRKPTLDQFLKFTNSETTVDNSCDLESKIRLEKDGRITTSKTSTSCAKIGSSDFIKDDAYGNDCAEFDFITVSPIKNIPNHFLTWNSTSADSMDVNVDIFAVFHLRFPKWNDEMSKIASIEFAFFCERLRLEMAQRLAGNVNYRRFQCKSIEKDECDVDLMKKCHFKVGARLFFANVDEEIRGLLFPKVFSGEVTDCGGISCTLTTAQNAVGVMFTPQMAVVLNVTGRTATIRSHPLKKATFAAPAGFNVSVIGVSKIAANSRIFYKIVQLREGNQFVIRDLLPSFNYTCHIQQLYLQGVGNAFTVEFQTDEEIPDAAPSIAVVTSNRHNVSLNITEINSVNCNGFLLGYRVYYQSLLKMDSEVDLRNLTDVELTHPAYVNFETNSSDLSALQILPGLEVFTNYSLIIGAYNSKGIGPLAQIFWRTNQGEPEVYTPDFNISVVNSSHLFATWSPLTTDIELLNGWYLSNYTVEYQEYSVPAVFQPYMATRVVVAPNATSLLIGPLEAAREYKISIAGNVESRAGVFSSFCVRTDQDVPNASPRIANITGVDFSSLNYTTGCLYLNSENGEIIYYNISAMILDTNETVYYRADILPHRCLQINCSVNASSACYDRGLDSARYQSRLTARNCSSNHTELRRTSDVISYSVYDLRFWTNYSIQSAACTVKGCGPYNDPLYVTTDEHAPTCPPNITVFHNASSTAMTLAWNKLELHCSHGVLFPYNIFISLERDLTGSECFNHSSCWPFFDPASNVTSKYYKNSTSTTSEISGLKKYQKYCVFVQAVNAKGRGPTSNKTCEYTAEDEPDGPPAVFNVSAKSSQSIRVKLEVPSADVINGIIRGYRVFYQEINVLGETIGQNMTADFKREDETVTEGVINDLKEFTLYALQALAYTSIGDGPKSPSQQVKTLQDAPSAPPRNLTVGNVSSSSFASLFEQTEKSHLNGIFLRFNVTITENRLDNIINEYAFYAVSESQSPSPSNQQQSQNSSGIVQAKATFDTGHQQNAVNFSVVSDSFAVTLKGLLSYTYYNISIATCTVIGCGPAASTVTQTAEEKPSSSPEIHSNYQRTSTSLNVTWRELPIMERQGIITGYRIRWMKDCEYQRLKGHPLAEDCIRVPPENTTSFSVGDVGANMFYHAIEDLDPFTWYRCEVCAKTSVGYGPCRNVSFQTDESVPTAAPNVTKSVAVTGRSFRSEWQDVPPPYRQGIILGYVVFYQLNALLNGVEPGGAYFHSQRTTQYPPEKFMIIDFLNLKSNYTYKIAAFTSKGIGVNSSLILIETGDFKHGNWTTWGRWGFCSRSCGNGTKIRKRTCDNPAPFSGGDNCTGSATDSAACNTFGCSGPLFGNLGESCVQACKNYRMYCNPVFSLSNKTKIYEDLDYQCLDSTTNPTYKEQFHPSYVKDSKSCQGFQRVPQEVNCKEPPPGDGKTIRLCNCLSPVDCGCDEWAPWSLCSKEFCGGGIQNRRRTCSMSICESGVNVQSFECNTKPCPVDGNWGAWSEVTPCNKTCGYGYQHRYRKCDNPAVNHNGKDCYGSAVDYIPECNVQKCPVHGGWTSWSDWQLCDQPCGGGKLLRKRYCENPSPKYEGKYCEGPSVESQPCNLHACSDVSVLFTVKLVDFVWDFKLVYETHPKTVELSQQVIESVKAVYNYSSVLSHIKIINFKRGSVIANFTVYYAQASQGEVLLLQDFVDTTGKLYNLSTVVQVVTPLKVVVNPPENVSAVSYSERTMLLTWAPPDNYHLLNDTYGYYIFYREYSSPVGGWNVQGVPQLNSTSFTLRDLKPVTKYRFRMTLAVTTGNGPASNEAINSTLEGVPKISPKNFTGRDISPSQIYLTWLGITDADFNGRPLGYAIRYKKYFDTAYEEKHVTKISTETVVDDLKPFTLYDFDLLAFSGAGYGPPASIILKTPEGVPAVPPPKFASQRDETSIASLVFTWDKIPDDLLNGILLGYKLKYTITRISNELFVGAPITKVVELDKFTFRYKIDRLQSYTTYSVSVAGYTSAGDGPYSEAIPETTCKCPRRIFLNWFSNPPYVQQEPGSKVSGIMADLVNDMIKTSCGKCSGVASRISWYQSLSGESSLKKNELGVRRAIGSEYQLSFPIFGYGSNTKYMDNNVFALLIKSSGSASIVKSQIDYSAKTLSVLKSITNLWPMYLLVVCMTLLVGVIVWVMERGDNEEFTKERFIHGALQGFWWAFISMTTVGYGDITPRTVQGRVVAIVWTLAGLVLTGILTGALTSSVTSMTIPPAVTLYDAQCAAVNNSFEYFLGVRRNSKVNKKRSYQTYEEVLDAVKNEEVEIALLDAFTVAALAEELVKKSLKVSKLIDTKAGYGVVLSREFVRMESDFRSYISSQSYKISSFRTNMTEKLYSTKKKEEAVPLLFDPSTKMFWDMVATESIVLLIFSILGILLSMFRARRRKMAVNPASADLVTQLAAFDHSIAEFESKLQETVDHLQVKHQSQYLELVRMKTSYKRLLARKYPFHVHPPPFGKRNESKQKLSSHEMGESEI